MKGLVVFLVLVMLMPVQADPSDLRKLLVLASQELGHEQFVRREAALAKMQKIVEGRNQEALEHLRDLWRKESHPEVRARLSGLASELFLQRKSAYFGFRFTAHTPVTLNGKKCLSILVSEVVGDSPAERGGLKNDDLILGVGDNLIAPGSSLDDILAFFKKQPTGKKLDLKIRRMDEDLIIPVVPGEQDPTEEDLALFEKEFLRWLLAKK